MSRNLNDLIPEFRNKVDELLKHSKNSGYIMRPFSTLRTPFVQGKLWRQSRSREQVEAKIKELKNMGADFLAYCIESVGPRDGRHVTNAIPGLSWHQWGEAVDCFWLLDYKAEWSTRKKVNDQNGYAVYAKHAKDLGLNPGGYWYRFKDWVHVQFRKEPAPSKLFTLQEISQKMEEKFKD